MTTPSGYPPPQPTRSRKADVFLIDDYVQLDKHACAVCIRFDLILQSCLLRTAQWPQRGGNDEWHIRRSVLFNSLFTRRRSCSFAEYWKHFMASFNDLHASGSERTWMKFGEFHTIQPSSCFSFWSGSELPHSESTWSHELIDLMIMHFCVPM